MKIRILSGDDIRAALPMEKAIEAMRSAFGQLSAHKATVPIRTGIETRSGQTLLMPAHLQQTGDLSVKIVSVYNDNSKIGLPVVNACVIVLDHETGLPRAYLDGNSLTSIRTGAGGGLAADLLARQDAEVLALFGAGVQARAQLKGLLTVRTIRKINLISRTIESAENLAREIAEWPYDIKITLPRTSSEAIKDADIVVTATTSERPLFNGDELKKGAHVTGVGSYTPQMREVDDNTIRRSRVIVDSKAACLTEAGDIILAGANIDAELGEIVNKVKNGRLSYNEITFFKSVGNAAQDAAAAGAVLNEAENKGLGTVFHFEEP